MRVLLDECIDRRPAKDIEGRDVVTVPQAGWAGIKNGDLLRLAQERFDVFITADRNLSFQQHLPHFTIAVIVLEAPTNRLRPSPLAASTSTDVAAGPQGRSAPGEPVEAFL